MSQGHDLLSPLLRFQDMQEAMELRWSNRKIIDRSVYSIKKLLGIWALSNLNNVIGQRVYPAVYGPTAVTV